MLDGVYIFSNISVLPPEICHLLVKRYIVILIKFAVGKVFLYFQQDGGQNHCRISSETFHVQDDTSYWNIETW